MHLNRNIMGYILNKLAALGLLVFIMCMSLILLNGFDLYRSTETLSYLSIWGLIGAYALVTTMLIDLVRIKWISFSFGVSVFLHGIAGFIVFFPFMGFNFYAVLAGSVGALCAMTYAFSSYLLEKKKQYAWLFLLVFPLFLSFRLIDFTIKKDWTEEITATSFYAEFERFNGKNQIPIPLKKGDVVTVNLSFYGQNGGGYGFHILDEHGEYVAMEDVGEKDEPYNDLDETSIQFQAVKDGRYFIVVTGDELQGEIDVRWDIE